MNYLMAFTAGAATVFFLLLFWPQRKRHLWLLLLAPMCAGASQVRLAWDASPSAGVTNYTLFAHTNAVAVTNYSLATVRVNLGTNLTCTITDLAVGRWYLFVTATADGLMSDPSNVLQVEMARPPANLRTLTVQYGETLESMTNSVFFKLKVP